MFDLNKIVIKSIRKTNDVSMASSPTLNPNIFTPINVLESLDMSNEDLKVIKP